MGLLNPCSSSSLPWQNQPARLRSSQRNGSGRSDCLERDRPGLGVSMQPLRFRGQPSAPELRDQYSPVFPGVRREETPLFATSLRRSAAPGRRCSWFVVELIDAVAADPIPLHHALLESRPAGFFRWFASPAILRGEWRIPHTGFSNEE